MYETFFSLEKNPFDMTSDPSCLLMTKSHKEAFSGLQYALLERKGFVVLIGEAGTGKTTLLRALMHSSKSARFSVVLNTALNAREFLELVMLDFGITEVPESKAPRIVTLQNHLMKLHQEGCAPVLIVDEAHKLTPELLEEIRLLINFEKSETKLLQVVLSGQTELTPLLNREDLRQLKQRIDLRLVLDPLSLLDVETYMRHRWERAGGKNSIPFSAPAIAAVAAASGGIPRLVNSICDNALLLAYRAGDSSITAQQVQQVLRDMDLRSFDPAASGFSASLSSKSGVPLSDSDVRWPSREPVSDNGRAKVRAEDRGMTQPSGPANNESLAAIARPTSAPRGSVFDPMEEDVEAALALIVANDETRPAQVWPEASAPVTLPDEPFWPVPKPATPGVKPAGSENPSFEVSELSPDKPQERVPSFGTSAVESKPAHPGRILRILGVVILITGLSAYFLQALWMPAPKQSAPTPVATFPLQLELQPQGNGLINIRWNPKGALVAQAREARMVITERDQPPTAVALAPNRLKIGHLYYQSSADRVEFRLEVVDRSGAVSQESVMALSSAPAAPTPGPSPKGGAAQNAAVKTLNAPGKVWSAVPGQAARAVETTQPKPAIRAFTIPPPAPPSAQEGRVILPDAPLVVGGEATNPAPATRLPDAGGAPPPVKQAASAPQLIRVGGAVQSADLIRRVTPVYPELARKARVQGTVRFSAVIGKGGVIQDLQLVSGPSLLVQAAADAVKQWVYRPTLLNGEPVEVITQIEVNFSLSQ